MNPIDRYRPFRQKLLEHAVLGPFSKTSDGQMIEAIGQAGMDFIILDLEHGPNDIANLADLIRAAEASGMAAVVRPQRLDQVGRALDLGATAVQMPHVSSADDARRLVHAARFAPDGQRGVCRYVRAAGYSAVNRQTYFTSANACIVIAQVEGTQGLRNLPAIIDVPGIDVIFVGVYDLSQSLGLTGQVEAPAVQSALEDVARQCRDRGITCGTFVESVEQARRLAAMGMRYLCYGVDVGLLLGATHATVQAFRAGDAS
jgi:4-hydroxy-2-oxoheptanedioate aldolase